MDWKKKKIKMVGNQFKTEYHKNGIIASFEVESCTGDNMYKIDGKKDRCYDENDFKNIKDFMEWIDKNIDDLPENTFY